MAPKITQQPTIDEIRNTFVAMIGRLKEGVEKIPDELLGKAKLVHLEIFLAHSRDIIDPNQLLDFCLSVLVKMKYSIDAAGSAEQGRLTGKALKGPRSHDGGELDSIMFEGLQRLGGPTVV
jgi:hypothetical protein